MSYQKSATNSKTHSNLNPASRLPDSESIKPLEQQSAFKVPQIIQRTKSAKLPVTHGEILQLQHKVGNRVVQRLLAERKNTVTASPDTLTNKAPSQTASSGNMARAGNLIQREPTYYTGTGEDSWRGYALVTWRTGGKEKWDRITTLYNDTETFITSIEDTAMGAPTEGETKSKEKIKTALKKVDEEPIKFTQADSVIQKLTTLKEQAESLAETKTNRLKREAQEEQERQEQERIRLAEIEKRKQEALLKKQQQEENSKKKVQENSEKQKLEAEARKQSRKLEKKKKEQEKLDKQQKESKKRERNRQEAEKRQQDARDKQAAKEKDWQPAKEQWEKAVTAEKTHTHALVKQEKMDWWAWETDLNKLFEKEYVKAEQRGKDKIDDSITKAHDAWTEVIDTQRTENKTRKTGTTGQWRTWSGIDRYEVKENLGTHENKEMHVTFDEKAVEAPMTIVGKTTDEVLDDILKVYPSTIRIHATLTANELFEDGKYQNPHVYWPDVGLNDYKGSDRYNGDWDAAKAALKTVLEDYVTTHVKPKVATEVKRLGYTLYPWPNALTIISESH